MKLEALEALEVSLGSSNAVLLHRRLKIMRFSLLSFTCLLHHRIWKVHSLDLGPEIPYYPFWFYSHTASSIIRYITCCQQTRSLSISGPLPSS